MNKIKIRYKMMLWYTLLTSILLAIFIPILYATRANSFYRDEVSRLRGTMVEAISSIEADNNAISINNTAKIANDVPTIIWDNNNNVVFRNTDIPWMYTEKFANGKIRTIEKEGEKWLVFDQVVLDNNIQVARVRVASSFESIENTVTKTKLITIFTIPIYLLITILGGLLIAKKALSPIRDITKAAKKIGRDNLSERITNVNSNDEVGELAEIFNEMLNKLELSFKKEKAFASDASHELRTPVAIIIAYCEELLSEPYNGKKNESIDNSLELMLKESKRMNGIISQLLMLTRGYEGRYILEFEHINLAEVIPTVIEQLDERAGNAGILLSYDVRQDISLVADQSLITQMMLNLVENAIKYGKYGGNVNVTAKEQDSFVVITVSDDGMGIAPENLPHIFERFYRVDQSRDRSGTGLGLSIVSWIVEEHHGKINVQSEFGKGTSFEIKLPAMISPFQ